MKRVLSLLIALSMIISCVQLVAADSVESTTASFSVSKCGANAADNDTKWNMAITGINYYYFAYDVSALAEGAVSKAEFKFKVSSDAETLNFYEITSDVSAWGNGEVEGGPLFPVTPAPTIAQTAFASIANDGTGIADITSYVREKIEAGETTVQFAVNTNQYRISLGSLSSSKPTLDITTVSLDKQTASISKTKRGASASDNDTKWNMAINGTNYYYFAFDASRLANRSVSNAEFSFKVSTTNATLKFYEITSDVSEWGNGEVEGDPLFPVTPAPTIAQAAFATIANGGTGVADITSYVKEKLESGTTMIQFAVKTTGDRISLGSLNSSEPTLSVTTTKKITSPSVTITSPTETTFDEGSTILVNAIVTDEQGIDDVKITMNGTALEVTADGNSYSASTGVLENGQYTIKVTAENIYGQKTEKSVTIYVGYQSTSTSIAVAKCGANAADDDTKWNMAVTGTTYYYIAYDASAMADNTLEKAEFKFKVSDADETLNFYEITTPVSEWGNAEIEGDPLFPVNPAPTIAETAFSSVQNDGTGTVDLTSYVEEKLAKGETMIQFAVNTNQYRVSLGSLTSSKPTLDLTTSSLLRPAITMAQDYSYVTPGNTNISFTVNGNGAAITSVTATVNGVEKAATVDNGTYTVNANLAKGVHTVSITAVNDVGSKKTIAYTVNAIDYEVETNDIVVSAGVASGTATINSYTGVLDKAVVIMAVYNDQNTMIDKIAVPYNTLVSGANPVSATIGVPSNAKTVKMFIWYDIAGLKSLCDAEVIGL